ncbi:MAG: ribosomal-processing cysteine protease Prp [Oscillospiraceae bacterium]|nr:ribosomal-processing cysteine protease Prp [Oscillospiraceae bacterium]
MIKAVFYRHSSGGSEGVLCGFSVSGHAGCGSEGNDIVCAAVSSAVMLVCNAVTDHFKAAAEVGVEENRITLALKEENTPAQRLIEAFYGHLEIIAEEHGRVKLEVKFTGG